MGRFDGLKTVGDTEKAPDEAGATPLGRIVEDEEVSGRFDGLSTVGGQQFKVPLTSALTSIKLSEQLDGEKEARAFKLSKERKITMPLARKAVDKGIEAGFPSHNQLNVPAINNYTSASASNPAISKEDMNDGTLVRVNNATSHDTRRVFNIDNSDPIDENDPFDAERLKRESEPTFSFKEKTIRAKEVGDHNLKVGDLSYADLTLGETPERELQMRQLESDAPEFIPGDNILEDVVTVSATMEPLIERSFVRSQEEATVFVPAFMTWAAAMGQLGPQVATPEELITVPIAGVIGYGAGVTVGAAKTIYQQEAGHFYKEAKNIRDVNGEPIDRNALRAASHGYAAISTGMELIGLKYILKTIPGAEKFLGKLTKPAVKKILQNPSVVKRLASAGIALGTAVGVNAFQEASQETAAIVSEELTKYYSENKDGTYFLPFDWKGAFKTRVAPAGVAGALGGFGWGTPGTVASVVKIGVDVTTSNKFQQKFDIVQEEINKAITKERSEAHAEQYLKATELEPEAYISPEGVEILYQEDDEKAKTILTNIGVDPIKAREKAVIGQDTTVDLALLHSKKLTQEEIDTVQTYLKPKPDSYTKKQLEQKAAVEEMELLTERWNEQQEVEDEFNSQITNIKDQIVKAGLEEQFGQDTADIFERAANSFSLEGSDRTAFANSITIQRKKFLRPRKSENSVLSALNIKTDPRGEIVILKGETGLHHQKYIINLFKEADESTVVHELLGHVFLEEMDFIGKTEGISEQFKKDVNSIYNWLGAKEGDILNRNQKEQFARGYEQFLREGKAPTIELSSVFARFKNWLKNIYSSAMALDVQLSDEIRGVFNRIIDAENETRTAAALNDIVALTPAQMDAVGIVDEKQANMRLLVQTAMQKAERKLFMARDKAVKTNTEALRSESEREVLAEDVNDVYEMIDTIIADGLQFDRAEYNEAIGNPKGHEFLPSKRITKRDGVSLENTAFFFGFGSTEEFVDAISTTLPKKTAINNKLNLKLTSLQESFNSEDYITSTPEYLSYLTILGEELKRNRDISEQAAKTGRSKKTISREQIKKFARETLDASSVIDAKRPDLYLAAMKRASIAQSKAIKNQDWATALRENERVRLNHEMARLAVKNRDLVDKVVKRSKASARSKTIINNHREQIRAIVQRYKISPTISPDRPGNLTPLPELFKSEQHKDGFIAPAFLINPNSRDYTKRYQRLRLEQFKKVDDAIKYLTKMGREEHKQLLSDGIRKIDDVVIPAVEEMQTRPFKENKDKLAITAGLAKKEREIMASLMGFDYIFKMLGGTSLVTGELSSLEQNVTEPLKDVRDDQIVLYKEKSNDLKPHSDHLIKSIRKLNNRVIKIPFVPVSITAGEKGRLRVEGVPVPEILQDRGAQKNYFTPEQVFAMAGHRGSQSNIDALISGYPGLTLTHVDTLLNEFVIIEDMHAIQAIRDILDTLKKPNEEVHLRMKGYAMSTVEATPYVFKGEEFRGGRWPISIDKNLALNTGFLKKAEIKTAIEKHDSKYASPHSADGHTNKRVKHKLPISLTLAGIYKDVDQSTRYVTQSETVRDVDRIIQDDRFKQAAIDVLGKEQYNELRPALEAFANPRIEGYDVPGNWAIKYLRSLATSSNLAFRAITAPKQLGSISGAIHDMGKGKGAAHGFQAYANGMTHVVANASVAYNSMREKSPYMDQRMGKIDRDFLRPRFNKMTPAKRAIVFGDREVTWSDVVDTGFLHIKAFDAAATTPLWWGSYLDKINEPGVTEKQAVRYADNIIQGSQPNVDLLTLPPWLRKGGFFSLFNLHQTFTVGIYGQRQRAYFSEWRAKKISTVQYAWFNFMDAFVPIMSIQIMVALLRGKDLKDRETWFDIATGAITQWLTMGLPIANSFFGAIAQNWRTESILEIPGSRAVQNTADMFKNMGKAVDGMDQKEKERLFYSFLQVAGDYSRFPVGRLAEQTIKEEGFRGKMFGTDFEVKKKQKKTQRRRR